MLDPAILRDSCINDSVYNKVRDACLEDPELYSIVQDVIKDRRNSIIGVAKNKWDDHVLVVLQETDNDIWVVLYSYIYNTQNHPRIMATPCRDKDGNLDHIRIDDILVHDKKINNGSILMEHFVEYCKSTNAKYIDGEISSEDSDHFDRLTHYYKKYDFDIIPNDEGIPVGIKYILR